MAAKRDSNLGMVNIDPDKLREECKKRGLHYTEVSRECGYSNKLLDNAFTTGRVKAHVVKMLDLMYNIKPETYVLSAEASVKKNADEETVADDDKYYPYWERLYEVTYEAVYNAFKKVMSE